ncbi:MAG: hypothetical protein J5830_05785 [Clostridia bacterium]|nr:hypothetical protein [Clostridia bacterium]
MRKALLINIVLVVVMTALLGCSSDKSLGSFRIKPGAEIDVVISNEPSNNSIEDFFSEDNKKGFIGKIKPLEFSFYYEVRYVDFSDYPQADGYAVCTCEILNISDKYNSTGLKTGDKVEIKLNIFPDYKNEKKLLKMMKETGSITKDGKTAIPGTYRMPDWYVNSRNFDLIIEEYSTAILTFDDYYAFVIADKGINHLGQVCFAEDNDNKLIDLNLPEANKDNMKLFSSFIKENPI